VHGVSLSKYVLIMCSVSTGEPWIHAGEFILRLRIVASLGEDDRHPQCRYASEYAIFAHIGFAVHDAAAAAQ
jgi:hypothetical protein